VALILALNPGNSHSPTLSRLARELQGCELIGAESSPVAIRSIKERRPDVILLPAKEARGQADLLAHLKTIPGGVLTLKLPPVDRADPTELARQIRELLTGTPAHFSTKEPAAPTFAEPEPVHVGAPPELLAAATAAINWIRTRQAQWAEPIATAAAYAEPQRTHEPHRTYEPHEPYEPHERQEPDEPQYYEPLPLTDEPFELDEPSEPDEPPEPSGPSIISRAAGAAAGVGGRIVPWLPRLAAIAVVIGIGAALVSYWPRIRSSVGSAVERSERRSPPPESPAAGAKPAVTAKPEPEPDPLAKVSGWVAVFAPFDLTISEGGRGVQVDDRGRAMLAPGRHRLRFQNKEFGYDETRSVDVRPTDTTTVNLTPATSIAVTSNEPAEVLVDGTRVGDTPYQGRLGLGTHTVTVKSAGAERQLTVRATSKPVQLEVDFSKP
jgi:hypothetical protein